MQPQKIMFLPAGKHFLFLPYGRKFINLSAFATGQYQTYTIFLRPPPDRF